VYHWPTLSFIGDNYSVKLSILYKSAPLVIGAAPGKSRRWRAGISDDQLPMAGSTCDLSGTENPFSQSVERQEVNTGKYPSSVSHKLLERINRGPPTAIEESPWFNPRVFR